MPVPQHVLQLVLVLGRHHDDVGQGAEVGEIVEALVGGAVGTDDPRAVEREGDVEVLETDVVHHLIVGALQERGVDRRHGLHPLAGETSREGHRVLLRDTNVVEALWKGLFEAIEPGAVGHGRRDGHDALVLAGQADQGVGEDILVLRRPAGLRRLERSRCHVEGPDTVVLERILLGGLVAVPLRGDGVHQDRPLAVGQHRLHVREGLEQNSHAVPLDRAHVLEVQRLEQDPRREEDLERLLGLVRPVAHMGFESLRER
jgi:hypothetical protein